MHSFLQDADLENWHDFEVESRREIVALLRGIGEKNQMIRLLVKGEADVCVTAILDVQGDKGLMLLDCSIDPQQNQRILTAQSLHFETTLDKIRILFTTERAVLSQYKGAPALQVALPATLIRLQRREYYRMSTLVSNPVRVDIVLPGEKGPDTHSFPLADISCGGIAILDNRLILGDTIGRDYPDCRIDLPDIGTITTTLQIRNTMDLTLLNNKTNRRIGCQFVNPSRQMLTYVQRYITRLERERNARIAGLN